MSPVIDQQTIASALVVLHQRDLRHRHDPGFTRALRRGTSRR